MEDIVKVLLIEDNPADARLLEELLNENHDGQWGYRHAEDLTTGLALLKAEIPDVILLDLDLPDVTGMQGVDTIFEKYPSVPVVILSGRGEEVTAIEAVQHGASDYVVKGQGDGDRIWQAVCFAIARFGRAKVPAEPGAVRGIQVPADNHLATLLPHMARHDGSTIMINIARPFKELEPLVKAEGMDKVWFVDAASGDMPAASASNATFIDSPTQLEKIMMRAELIAQRLAKPVKIVVDSVNLLCLYNDSAATHEFVHSMATRCRSKEWSLDLVFLDNEQGRELMKATSHLVDTEAILSQAR